MKIYINAGFSLVEIIIVTGVALIIGALLISILVSNTGVYNKENSIIFQGLSINDTLSEIETHLRQATSVAAGYPEASPTYISGQTTLVFKIPSINNQGIIDHTYDFVVITQDESNTKLLKEYIFPDTQSTRQAKNTVLTNSLDSVLFEYLDNNDLPVNAPSATKIRTTINLSSKIGILNQQRNATIITSLRNL